MQKENIPFELLISTSVLLLILIFTVGTYASDKDYQCPPKDLVINNLLQCEQSVELLVKDVKEVKIFKAGSGQGGYVQCLVNGTVTRNFKGKFFVGEAIAYYFTCEFDSVARCPVLKGKEYVVFLRNDPKTGKLWLFEEVAQFLSSPEVTKILDQAISK